MDLSDGLIQTAKKLAFQYNIIGVLDLTKQKNLDWIKLHQDLKNLWREKYQDNDQLLILMDHDWYDSTVVCGCLLESIQRIVNHIDISNFFVNILTTNPDIEKEQKYLLDIISTDPVPIKITVCRGEWYKFNIDNNRRYDITQTNDLEKHDIDQIDPKDYELLFKNPSFCMAPWSHLLVGTDKLVYPCCKSQSYPIGDLSKNTLKEIWNDLPLRDIRQHMLSGKRHPACQLCYLQEDSGNQSYRNYINRKLVSRVKKIKHTSADGFHEKFEINYLHFRFSNLCNLACRTCGPVHSSSWHQISTFLGTNIKDQKAIQTSNDDGKLYNEFQSHIDNIDLIKFTGGEPLIMQEFYDILDLLIEKNRTGIDLFYNTNLMQLNYRRRSILDLWQHFPNITVAASLDAQGARGEYIRSFSDWDKILKNYQEIKTRCPHVYLYFSPTISIFNALHLPDFHRSSVDQGLIHPQDFDINFLFTPTYLYIVNSPDKFKEQIKTKYSEHIKWLETSDKTGRSTSAFRSVIELLENNQGSFEKDAFWHQIDRLDQYHGTNLLDVFPELSILPSKIKN